MAGYIGTQPVPQATQHRESFTATSSQTSFATAGYSPQFLDVYLNGVHLLDGTDYTASNGSDVVLTTGAATGDIVEVVSYTPFEVADQTFTGDTATDNLSVSGTFTSQGIDDNATSTAMTLDSSGNVGIGTSSPDRLLHIEGSVPAIKFTDTDVANQETEFVSLATGGLQYKVDINSVASDPYHAFVIGTSEAMRIDSSGHAIIPAGVTLGTSTGVYAAANTLDDYEEGTWTPTAGSNLTINSVTNARYVKVGQMVHAYAYISITTSSNGFVVDGLPFNHASSGYGPAGFYFGIPQSQVTHAYVNVSSNNINCNTTTTHTGLATMLYATYVTPA